MGIQGSPNMLPEPLLENECPGQGGTCATYYSLRYVVTAGWPPLLLSFYNMKYIFHRPASTFFLSRKLQRRLKTLHTVVYLYASNYHARDIMVVGCLTVPSFPRAAADGSLGSSLSNVDLRRRCDEAIFGVIFYGSTFFMILSVYFLFAPSI